MSLKETLDTKWKLHIGGEQIETKDSYEIVDPNTTEVIAHAPEATVSDAIMAAEVSSNAFKGWKNTPMEKRCEYLALAADKLEEVTPSWADLVQAETGSTINIAKNMQLAGTFINRFRQHSVPKDINEAIQPLNSPANPLAPEALLSAYTIYQPVGVVACITPYNFPLTNVAGKIAPALMMGNTVIIKPAPQDPLAVIKLGEVLSEIFPPGVVNVVVGSKPEVGSALVDSKLVNMISFTGSSQVGAKIFEQSGKTMKRLLMELGGKGRIKL